MFDLRNIVIACRFKKFYQNIHLLQAVFKLSEKCQVYRFKYLDLQYSFNYLFSDLRFQRIIKQC